MQILIDGILDHDYVVRRQAAAIYKERLNEDRSAMVPPVKTTVSKDEIVAAIRRYPVSPRAILITGRGKIEFELRFDLAPLTVINFVMLAREGFYDGLIFHRVIPNFVAQGGDPRGDGWGGPAHYMRCEYSAEPYVRGTVGIATSGKDTGGSQFFITHSPQSHLNGRYTVFGEVIEGMDVVDQIVRGDVIEKVLITEGAE
jgi:cyclophilin family peptidyl-prolyl cis-trans isomerase